MIFVKMAQNNPKVLFIASECAPIAKVGGLGDVIGSLPKALFELGVDVRIALPKYKVIDFKKYPFKLAASKIKVKDELINIYKGFLPESKVLVYLLENKKYFGENNIYFERTAFVGSFKEIERFLFFSQAVLEIFPVLNWFPETIHCHDWHTSMVPVFLKNKNVKTLLTIHNLANQGKWKAEDIFNFLNLRGNETESFKKIDKKGNLNILQQGILNADLLNAVSENYAKEIQTPEYGEGLENFLLERKNDLYGILNGIDGKIFNPQADPCLKINYFSKNLEKKIENKKDLQEILFSVKNPEIPLIGFIGRLTPQKGIDLIIEIIPEIVKLNCQIVILGLGMADYEKKILELSKKYPKNVSAQIKFDAVLAQKIYGGSDIFLMPSQFEPCGLGQMIAMAYGTLPIVRKTGGLADTVEDKKTGFVFKKYDSQNLLKSLKEALNLYKNQREWQELAKRTMAKDFSWSNSAKKYLELYQKMLQK